MSRDPLTKEQMEAMNFEKVWISYGVDENGVDDGEWGVILFGRLYSIDVLEGAGMEELLQDLSNGESISDAEKQYMVYSQWLPGTSGYWSEVIWDLKHLKVETGSLACLGCKRERQCATKGCFIIREALCLLGVSNLDTSQQATDSLGQSTEVDDGKGN